MASSAKRSVVSEVSSGGFTTTELPAARAGPSFQASMASGKFHGSTAPTTPIGSWTIMPRAPSPAGAVFPKSLSAASAYQRIEVIVSGRSNSRQSVSGLPASIASVSARSSRFSSSSATRRRISRRSEGCMRLQTPESNAARAEATARSTSCASHAAMSASFRPVAGSMLSKVAPETAGTKPPSR